MNELIKLKMSDANEMNWPLFLKNYLKEDSSGSLEVESERKLCENCDYLFFEKDRLYFHSAELGQMHFDFSEEMSYHRRCNYAISKEPLAKALNIKGSGEKRIIWDTTCGTGKDSLLIHHFGGNVKAFERNPAIFLLLKDAQRIYPVGIDINFGDASKLQHSERPEVIYYDPMYPSKKKSALPRKEMRIFKEIVGADLDSNLFFEWAMKTATERVVIKRPLDAPFIGREPTASYKGKSTRYDMYKIF